MEDEREYLSSKTTNALMVTLKKEVGDYFDNAEISDTKKLNVIALILVSFFALVFSLFVIEPMNNLKIRKKGIYSLLSVLFAKIRSIISHEIEKCK